MSRTEFIALLSEVAKRYSWRIDVTTEELVGYQRHAQGSPPYSPLTAICFELTGHYYDPFLGEADAEAEVRCVIAQASVDKKANDHV